MANRRIPFRPTTEDVEPRLLLSTAHHPAAYTGTIHGEFKAVEESNGISFQTFVMVKTSGTLTPYGSVGLSYGFALDHTVQVGSVSEFFPFPNQQSLNLDITSHGREEVGIDLLGPVVGLGTRLQAGQYQATISTVYPAAINTLATRTAILTIPKGLPQHPGQLKPFTITLEA